MKMNDFPCKWLDFLTQTTREVVLPDLELRVQQESERVLPNREDWFKAFELLSPEQVKVVIVGQDPYIDIEKGTPQAMGMSFSVPNGHKCPPSLRNMFKEMVTDLGGAPFGTDLTRWARQGVLLLNRVLTVRFKRSNSHKGWGWEVVTEEIIRSLSSQHKNIAFVLWGNDAQELAGLIDSANGHMVHVSPHPSPLSAYRGFFGSQPFSKVNAYLERQGRCPIDWIGEFDDGRVEGIRAQKP